METAVVFGGSGFIGRRLATMLVERGMHVIIPSRRRELVKGGLIVLPNTDVAWCDPADTRSMAKLVAQADVVFNLIGILHESRRHSFEDIHVEFVRRLTEAISRSDKVRRLVHFSSLNAMTGAPSRYLRSKGKGESFVKQLGKVHWTIIRPSVVFGNGDSFVGMFRRMVKLAPMIALPSPNSQFQPIWVDDLAAMAAASMGKTKCFSKELNAGGPEVLRLAEIMSLVQESSGTRRPVIPLGNGTSRLLASLMEMVPFLPPTLTRDNIDSMSLPSTCQSRNDAAFLVGGALKSLREYLHTDSRHRGPSGSYSAYRHVARRG